MRQRTMAGTRQAVIAAALGSAAMIAHLVMSKAARDALFLSTFSVDRLPRMTIAAAFASLVSALATASAVKRFGPGPVLSAALAASALLHGGEWSLLNASPGAAAILLYVHVGLFGATTLAAFWSLVNESFDPHTAKREVSRITMGGTLGGIGGGLVAWQLGSSTGVPALLVVLALLNVGAVAVVPRLAKKQRITAPISQEPGPSALTLLARVPYLRQLALVVGLCALVSALLDYVIGARAVKVLSPGPDLVAFFALFHAGIGLGAFVLQLVATRATLERFGLAAAVGLLPAAILIFGGIAFAVPALWSVVLLRGAEGIVGSSLYRAGYELSYTPLPPEQKRPTKMLIDIGLDRAGTMIGGGVALLVVSLWAAEPARLLTLLAMAAAVVALLAALRLHSGYVSALARNLETGAVRLSDSDLLDATTRRTLAETAALDRRALLAEIERRRDRSRGGEGPESLARTEQPADPLLARAADLRSGDAARIRRGLADPLPVELAALAIELLADDASSRRALAALRAIAPRITGLCVDVLLDRDKSPVVRRRIPRVLEVDKSERSVDGLLEALNADEYAVRYQAALALVRMREEDSAPSLPVKRLTTVAARELGRAREDKRKETIDRQLELVITLLSTVLDRDPLRLAHRALYGTDDALRGTALEYLENVLPEELRTLAMPLFARARPAGVRIEPPPPSLRRRERRELVAELMRSREILLDRKALTDPRELG